MAICTPRYKNPDGSLENTERMHGAGSCGKRCLHWNACIIELKGGNAEIQGLSETIIPKHVYLKRKTK